MRPYPFPNATMTLVREGWLDYGDPDFRTFDMRDVRGVLYLHTPVGQLDPFYVGETFDVARHQRPWVSAGRWVTRKEQPTVWGKEVRRLGRFTVRSIAQVDCTDLRKLMERALERLHQPIAQSPATQRYGSAADIAWALQHPVLWPWLREWISESPSNDAKYRELLPEPGLFPHRRDELPVCVAACLRHPPHGEEGWP